MSTSQAQHFVNQHGKRKDLAAFLDRQPDIERNDCPLGSEVAWFFGDGSIIVHDFGTGWEIVDGTPESRGVGAEPLR